MILEKSKIQQIVGSDAYSCIFNEKKFSYLLFRDQVSPFGDIIAFQYKTLIGSLEFNNSLVFCLELLNVNMYGGVCFQRLFSTLMGSLLSELTQKEVYVNEGCIFIEEKQCSITLINVVKSSALIHIIFPQQESNSNFYYLRCSEEEISVFQQKVIEGFYQLTKSIFLQTQHDNF